MEGWQERQRQDHRAQAWLMYRYGMAFTAGEWPGGRPEIYEIFPLWTDEEINQMELEKIKATMKRWAAQKITKKVPK